MEKYWTMVYYNYEGEIYSLLIRSDVENEALPSLIKDYWKLETEIEVVSRVPISANEEIDTNYRQEFR